MALTHDGGKPNVRPMPYAEPKGPSNLSRQGPGLGGDNHGQCGTQGSYHESHSESGSPGIGGSRMKAGTQR